MLNQVQINARQKALHADADAAYADFRTGKITQKRFDSVMDTCEREMAKLAEHGATRSKAMRYASNASPGEHGRGSYDDPDAPAFNMSRHTKSLSGPKNPYAPGPLDASQAQWRSLFDACNAQTPFQTTVTSKAWSEKIMSAGGNIGMKAPPLFTTEGAGGSLLPAELIPSAFRLQYEPDRIWSHLVGMPMDTQQIEWLQHTSNQNPAATTAEVQVLPDLGMVITPKTSTAVKIGGTATFSRELLDDFSSFMAFVPSEITRAVIDAETNFVVNDGTQGILAQPNIITRNAAAGPWPAGPANNIDAILAGANDIRVGTSFAKADLVLMHPTTWLDIRTLRGTTGMYVLRQNEPSDVLGETLDTFFDTRVVQNTKIAPGIAIVLDLNISLIAFTRMGLEIAVNWQGDSVFPTFAYQWRVVERIALGTPRPSAIAVVSGLSAYTTGGS